MTGRPRWRGRAGEDTGASLVLALALMTFLGLVIGALLSYSAASIRATKATDGRAARTYAADGALKTAINQVRNSDFNNDPGQACPELSVPGSTPTALRITCTAGAGTGAASERVPITSANGPAQTVLALGALAGEPGIAQQAPNALRVQGKVFSTGPITTGTGSLESLDAAVVSKSTCTGTVISRNALGVVVPTVCAATASIPGDPNYPQPSAGLVYRPLPTCDTGSTVEFVPGYYDDAVGLSAMMAGTGPCAGKTFHFRPAAAGIGIYYFDFHNGEGGGLPTGPRVWTIDDRNAEVVGGTPQGWVPDAAAPVSPGACVSPLTATTSPGVQFVFGGDSRLHLKAGSVELCGQYSTSTPPVALYGAKTGNDTVTGPTVYATDRTGTNPGTGPTFSSPTRIQTTDNLASSAVIDATSVVAGVTASVVVKGFVPPAGAIPAGSLLTAAKLAVVHRDNNATAESRLSLLRLTITPTRPGAAAFPDVPQPTIYQDGPDGTAFHTDTLDLLPTLAADVHTYGFTGMQVRYDAGATLFSKVTEHLDSIRLTLTYRKPAVRGQRIAVNGGANCIASYAGGCDLLETEAGATLSVQGTLYAPYALADLRLTDVTAPVVRAGLVVRALRTQATGRAGYDGPVLEVPNTSTGPQPLDVYFRAYLSTKVVATARVRFPASDPTVPPTPGRRAVTVLSWTIRRN